MTPLQEFQQTSQLPFVGRTAELERIVAFWQATPDAQLLRCALVVAEAGVGKSRLLEEAVARIEAGGGTVVHVKLYPEAGNALPQLLARALWQSNAGTDLLRTQPEESLSSVISALRRLCRLRSTIVVIEDIHLLSADAVTDLSTLIDALADETLSVLALGRPSTRHALGALERVLVERIELKGLDRDDLQELWRVLFEYAPDGTLLDRFHEATAGNALAVRSGIRAAIELGMVRGAGDAGTSSAAAEQFATRLARSVELLSEGMVSHLTAEELEGARQLAMLGEVFAVESAHVMAADADTLIATLVRKGILIPASTDVAPVVTVKEVDRYQMVHQGFPSSSRPLHAFAHTLLHRHLADHGAADIERLACVIGDNLPLYSLFPFHALGAALPAPAPVATASQEGNMREMLIPVVHRLGQICYLLNRMAGWREIDPLMRIAHRLVEAFVPELPEEEKLCWQARLWELEMACNYRMKSMEEQRAAAEQMLTFTGAEPAASLAPFRLAALNRYLYTTVKYNYSRVEWAQNEVRTLLDRFPEMRISLRYVYYLAMLTDVARQNDDHAMVQWTLDQAQSLLAEPELSEGLRERIFTQLFTSALIVFSSEKELREREALVEQLLPSPRLLTPDVGPDVNNFFMHTGRFDELIDLSSRLIRVFREQGSGYNAFIAQLNRTMAESGFAADMPSREILVRAHLEELQDPLRKNACHFAGMGLAMYSLLRCDAVSAERMLADHVPDRSVWNPCMPLLFTAARADYAGAAELAAEARAIAALEDEAVIPVGALIRAAAGDTAGFDEALPEIIAWLQRPPLRIWNFILFHAAARMYSPVARVCPEAATALHEALCHGMTIRLEWLAERGLFGLMLPMIEEFGALLGTDGVAAWRKRCEELRQRRQSLGNGHGGHVRISMLGTIRAGLPGQELEPLRGSRVRLVLGLMVADQMIGRTLTHKEFVQIAGGGEDDNLELARKKRNMTVVRLREVLGHDAILTDGATPALNLDRVQVDVLLADDLIRKALAAVREGSLVRAQPLLLEALSITAGEVPFPTLYDGFFEAAREDFEYRLRSAIIDVAHGLLREGDRAGAETILRRGFDAMPDDEEIAELLQETLRSLGRRMDAERIRMRAKEAAG